MDMTLANLGDTWSTKRHVVRRRERRRPVTTEDDLSAAEALAVRLDKPMGALGVLFALVVLGQSLASQQGLVLVLTVLAWTLWVVFVLELALRAYVARNQRQFWRRNWWQLLFLVVPFLRFARALTLLRAARVGAIVSASVRGSRSAGRLLSGRIGWLSAITAAVVLGGSQLLYVTDHYESYGTALHDAALSTVSGEPLSAPGVFPRMLEVALAIYSVAVFATLAGALGAYYLGRRDAEEPASPVPRQ